MKKKKIGSFGILTLCFCFLLTGCGKSSMIETSVPGEFLTKLKEQGDTFWLREELQIKGPLNESDLIEVARLRNIKFLNMEDAVVERIPDGIFKEKINLIEINLPLTLKSIGKNAFHGCYSLKTIEIPEQVSLIEKNAFSCCTSLNSVNFSPSVEVIQDSAFESCPELKSIELPEKIITLGDNVFAASSKISEYDISSENLKFSTVDGVLFNKQRNTLILYPTGKKEIEYQVPDGVEIIQSKAFLSAINLKSIQLPESLKRIENSAFKSCSNLTGLILPQSVEFLGDSVMASCKKVTVMFIPKNISSIGNGAFKDCRLIKFNVSPDNKTFTEHEDVLFNKEMTELICYPKEKSNNNYIVPDGVKRIIDNAFYNCDNLYTVKLPSSTIDIGKEAYKECTYLKSINIPEGTKEIKNHTFSGCENLREMLLPQSITNIEQGAFEKCGFVTVNLPKGVCTIEANLFKGCPNLKQIGTHDKITRIGKFAFSGCKNLETFYFPAQLDTIDESAFNKCVELKSIHLAGNVSFIGSNAFRDCCKLITFILQPRTQKLTIGDDIWRGSIIYEIIINNEMPFDINECFAACIKQSNMKVIVPKNCSKNFRDAPIWKTFNSLIVER